MSERHLLTDLVPVAVVVALAGTVLLVKTRGRWWKTKLIVSSLGLLVGVAAVVASVADPGPLSDLLGGMRTFVRVAAVAVAVGGVGLVWLSVTMFLGNRPSRDVRRDAEVL